MKKVNELDVSIKHALITNLDITLSGDKASFTVNGDLRTGAGQKVARFNYCTDHYIKDKTIELGDQDSHINALSAELFKLFTTVLYRKIHGQFGKLEAGK